MLVSLKMVLVLIAVVLSCLPAHAVLVLDDLGDYASNFNYLASTSSMSWTNNQTSPESINSSPGWYWQDKNTTLNYDTGFASPHNYGAYSLNNSSSDTDRSMGSYTGSSSPHVAWGIVFQNNSGQTISQIDVSYLGEQWRRASTDTDILHFSFSTSATDIVDIVPLSGAAPTGWTTDASLSFTAPLLPINEAPGTFPGFDPAEVNNEQSVSGTISVNVPNGQYLALRWYDGDVAGNDAALGIDDLTVSFTATAVPEPSAFLFGSLVCVSLCVVTCLRKRKDTRGI